MIITRVCREFNITIVKLGWLKTFRPVMYCSLRAATLFGTNKIDQHSRRKEKNNIVTCRYFTAGQPVIAEFAQRAKSIMTGRTNAHGCVWFHHNSGGTGLAGTVDHVRHEVQTGLEQQTVITGKQFLIHQLLHLKDEDSQREVILYKVQKHFLWKLKHWTYQRLLYHCLTCNGMARELHLGSGQLRHWTLPSRIWIWKYSVMQALQ